MKLEFAVKLKFQKLELFEKIYSEKFWKFFMVLEYYKFFFMVLEFMELEYHGQIPVPKKWYILTYFWNSDKL